jgi:hypothetical protein
LFQTESRSRKGRWNTIAWTPEGRNISRDPVYATTPCSRRSRLVLPEPLAPTTAMKSPCVTHIVALRTACTAP